MIKRYQKGSRMSHAVSCGDLVYIAGEVANDRKAGIEARLADADLRVEMTAVAAL